MFKGRKLGIILVLVLLIGLASLIYLTLQTTQPNSNASVDNNLNVSQVPSSNNPDGTMGPENSSKNFSASLSKDKTGTVTFSITDPLTQAFPTGLPSPSQTLQTQNLKSFVLTVKKIEVHLTKHEDKALDNWETLYLPLPVSVDLVALSDSGVANLGQTLLAAGNYSEVRLYIDKATVSFSDGKEVSLDTSKNKGTVRIIKDFSVDKGKNTNLLVDFNADKSYSSGENSYVFSPFVTNFLVSK